MSNPGEQPASGEPQIDYKAELEKVKQEAESLKKQNEEIRLEFMGDEYLEFLDSKNKLTPAPAKKEEPATPVTDDEFKGLTPKQIYERAVKDAESKITEKLTEAEKRREEESRAVRKAEVDSFFQENPDAAKYRRIMFDLSHEPKLATANLEKLYKAAKDHVKSLVDGPTESEKEKSRKSQGEKPGMGSSSFQKGGKRLSAEEANDEAWEEVVGSKGLPPAI